MGNRSYLVASPWKRPDPSNAEKFSPAVHTVATATGRIPFLWFALFSPGDVVRGAPLTTTKAALARLRRVTGSELGRGSLAPHAEALAQTLASAGGRYVAIELDEIGDLFRRRATFDALVKKALSGNVAALTQLSSLAPRTPFPALGRIRRADRDLFHSLLGTSHIRPVGWEPEVAPPKRKPKVNPGAALRDALAAGDLAAARALLASGADPAFADAFGSTFEQVFYGKAPIAMLDELVKAGAKLDAKQRIRGYPLIQAAWVGKPDLLRALLSRGADIHVLDPFGRTALAIATREGHVDAVKLLLEQAFTEKERGAAIREGSKMTTPSARAAVELLARR